MYITRNGLPRTRVPKHATRLTSSCETRPGGFQRSASLGTQGAVQQYKQYMRWHGHAWRAPMPTHGSGRFRVGGLLPERVSEHAQRLELARR